MVVLSKRSPASPKPSSKHSLEKWTSLLPHLNMPQGTLLSKSPNNTIPCNDSQRQQNSLNIENINIYCGMICCSSFLRWRSEYSMEIPQVKQTRPTRLDVLYQFLTTPPFMFGGQALKLFGVIFIVPVDNAARGPLPRCFAPHCTGKACHEQFRRPVNM